MSRMKFLLVLLTLAIGSFAPQARAQVTVKVVIAGSSGIWQAMGVGTYKGGACPTGSHPGCAHYTNASFNLNDSRPTLLGGAVATDVNNVWIVWDNTTADPNCATACNVWTYIKVDNTVGARCYFATPACAINVTTFPAAGNVISTAIWGADTVPPAPIQALFTSPSGVTVNVQAADIRPEDSLFAQCRVNSVKGGGSDGLNGLGLGTNPSGTCPAFGATLAQLEGTDLVSAYPGSTSTAHNLAFSLSGKDPFSGQTIPVFSVVAVGAVPMVFMTNREGALAKVTDASLSELQQAFSGKNCTGSVFVGGTAGNIDVYSREPLSGTMNAIEYTAFRLPRAAKTAAYAGLSQETGLAGIEPVNAVACTKGGARYQGIGQGELTKFILNSNTLHGVDGIGYTFFSYGNVSSVADSANYGYLTVGSVDPIFQVYGSTYDPGQPAIAGAMPSAATLPAACAGAFPCSESQIWTGGLSFPNVRNGTYRQWSLVRLVTHGATLTAVQALVASAQQSAVTTVPDFIPAVKTLTDPGLQLYRSHYTQEGTAPNNGIGGAGDHGGDEGGCIIAAGSTATHVVQREFGCVVGP
jgi:hypothetical protein